MSTALPPTLDLDGLLRRLHMPTVRRLYADLTARAQQIRLDARKERRKQDLERLGPS